MIICELVCLTKETDAIPFKMQSISQTSYVEYCQLYDTIGLTNKLIILDLVMNDNSNNNIIARKK